MAFPNSYHLAARCPCSSGLAFCITICGMRSIISLCMLPVVLQAVTFAEARVGGKEQQYEVCFAAP